MPAYQLQIKQVVDYPRCRIYRQFVHRLMADRSIRTSGGSGLFYFTVLCSYANFRTSYRRIDGISYTIYPGEWVCTLKEVSQWFRTRFQCQALTVLEQLQKQHFITFQRLDRGNVIRYKICDWARHNTVLEYNAPCQKDTGFFFLPISVVTDLISTSRCSEMDIILDLWVSTVYNDNQVQGSDLGPVVYFRNGTGNPLVAYTELAVRWGLSRATVGRVLKKLAALDYEKYGSVHPIQLKVSAYMDGNLAIAMHTWENGYAEPWASLTVNLDGERGKDCAFIDTNGDADFPVWLIRHGLAIPTGATQCSGYCEYPEYRFRADRLRELDPEGYAEYLSLQEGRRSA